MRTEHSPQPTERDTALPTILPFPSRRASSRFAEIAAREATSLLQQTRPTRLWTACTRHWSNFQRWRHWVLRPHTPYRAVFVIASPRSGSNLLLDYLSQLQGVECQSEVLNWGVPTGPNKFLHPHKVILHLQQSLQTLQAQHRGCKLFLSELEHYRLTVDDLENAFPKPIYFVLYRENLAEQFASIQAAKQTQQWILLPGQKAKKIQVTIDAQELNDYCHTMRRGYASLTATGAVADRGAVLSYEQLTTDPAGCLRNIVCPLLQVPFVEPSTTLRKQNTQSLENRVTNYAALASILNGTMCHLQLSSSWTSPKRSRAA